MPTDPDSGSAIPFVAVAVVGAVALVVFSVVALVGLQLVIGISGSMDGPPEDRVARPLTESGDWVSFESTGPGAGEITRIYSVNDSRGYAVALDGSADSYVQSDQTIEFASDDTWTACTWASVDAAAASDSMTALSLDGRVLLQYDGAGGNWSAWYYQEGARDSYRVNVSAPNQPGPLSLVCARHDGSTLSVSRNATVGDTADTTADSTANASLYAGNWDGRLEETRTFDDNLTATQLGDLHTNPVAPLTGTNRTARLYYDEGSGSSTYAFFADVTATVSNAAWVDGHDGQELAVGTDYEIDTEGGLIQALAGGAVDGAPTIWIDYEFAPSSVADVVPGIVGGFELLGVAALVIPAVVVIGLLVAALVVVGRAGRSLDFGGGRRGDGR